MAKKRITEVPRNGSDADFVASNYMLIDGAEGSAKMRMDLFGKASTIEELDEAKYEKPEGGIPKDDLSGGVQGSLDLADSALQATDIEGKADKVTTATNGDLAGLDSTGNLTDSGYKPSDFATTQALADEAAARQLLGTRIDNEATARENADDALGTRIDNEVTARENADDSLGTRIDNEATARENADDALDARMTSAESDIDNLESSVDSMYDSEVTGTTDEINVSSSTSGKAKTFVVSLANAIKTKIDAAYTHISDTVKHITATERTDWNEAYSHSQVEGNPHGTTIGEIDGLRSELTEIESDLAAVEELIPSDATPANQLADKAFVNSSITSNTATFRGTSAAGLTEAQFLAWADTLTKVTNDYVFWDTVDESDNVVYKRYKYNGSTWIYEFSLNNSSFTSVQWAAINSGITEIDVDDIGYNTAARHTHSNKNLLDSYTQSNANLADAVSKKHSHSNKTVLDNTTASFTTADETKLDGIEAGAQVNLPVDSALSASSTNPVQNKVVNSALGGKAPTSHASTATTYGVGDATNYGHVKVDSALSNTSTNPVQNKVVKSALADKQDAIVDLSTIRTNASNGQTAYGWGDHATWTPSFSQATSRANLNGSGETISTIFGKIKKWFADLKTVAFTGSYNDLTNKPTIPPAITVDSAMSSSSTNPVQNKVIKSVTDALSTRIDNIPTYDVIPIIRIPSGTIPQSNWDNYIYKENGASSENLYTFVRNEIVGNYGYLYLQRLCSDVENLEFASSMPGMMMVSYNVSTGAQIDIWTYNTFTYRKTLFMRKDFASNPPDELSALERDEVKRCFNNNIPCIMHARCYNNGAIEHDFNLVNYVVSGLREHAIFMSCGPYIDGKPTMYILDIDESDNVTCTRKDLLDASVFPIDSDDILDNSIGTAKINNNAVTTVKILDSSVTAAKIANSSVVPRHLSGIDLKYFIDGATEGSYVEDDEYFAATTSTKGLRYTAKNARAYMNARAYARLTFTDKKTYNTTSSGRVFNGAGHVESVTISGNSNGYIHQLFGHHANLVILDLRKSGSWTDTLDLYFNISEISSGVPYTLMVYNRTGNDVQITFRVGGSTALTNCYANGITSTGNKKYVIDANSLENILIERDGNDLYLNATWQGF